MEYILSEKFNSKNLCVILMSCLEQVRVLGCNMLTRRNPHTVRHGLERRSSRFWTTFGSRWDEVAGE